MTQTDEWYQAMADAIKARDHARMAIVRWQVKLDEAEKQILALSNGTNHDTEVEVPVTFPTNISN